MIHAYRSDDDVVVLKMEDKVSGEDYRQVKPFLEQTINNVGVLHFLIEVSQVESFSLGAAYEDLKFDLANLKNIGKTAIVGNRESQEKLAKTLNAIFPKEIKYFELEHISEARRWLHKES